MGYKTVGPVRAMPPQDLSAEFVAYVNFHYYSEWDEAGDALLEFLRTGDWSVYKRACAFARNYRDLGVPRTDGLPIGEPPAGAGPKDGPAAIPRWGKFCDCHKYGSGVFDMLARDRRPELPRRGDRLRIRGANPAVVRNGFGNRGWARQDDRRHPHLPGHARSETQAVAHRQLPARRSPLRPSGRTAAPSSPAPPRAVGWSASPSHAIWHNWVMHQNDYTGVGARRLPRRHRRRRLERRRSTGGSTSTPAGRTM